MNFEVLKRFKSKRNKVYLIKLYEGEESKLAVLKNYSLDNQRFLDVEYENIEMLRRSGITVPEVIYKDNNTLIMEYIQGELVVDLVERLDTGDWIDELSLWMTKLHSLSKGNKNLLKMDVNLRNFIYSEGQIYGLDFETLEYGDGRTDLANICYFILTNRPDFKRKKHIIMRRFLESYEKCFRTELKEMGKFLLLAKKEAKIRRIGS